MGEPGGLPSMGSHRIGHDCSDLAAAAVWNANFWSCVKGISLLNLKVSQTLECMRITWKHLVKI